VNNEAIAGKTRTIEVELKTRVRAVFPQERLDELRTLDRLTMGDGGLAEKYPDDEDFAEAWLRREMRELVTGCMRDNLYRPHSERPEVRYRYSPVSARRVDRFRKRGIPAGAVPVLAAEVAAQIEE